MSCNGIPNPDQIEEELRVLGALGRTPFAEKKTDIVIPSKPLPDTDRELLLRLISRIRQKQSFIDIQQRELSELIGGVEKLISLPPAG